MKLVLYSEYETRFSTNALQVLDNDVIEAEIEEEINSLYTLTFKLQPRFKSENLRCRNIVVAKNYSGQQAFRIRTIEKTEDCITVLCFHVFYDLLDNFIYMCHIWRMNLQDAINKMLENAEEKTDDFIFSVVDNTNGSYVESENAYIESKNIVSALFEDDNCITSRYRVEVERDNFHVNFKYMLGEDKGVQIRRGKNLRELSAVYDASNICTKILPVGYDGLVLGETNDALYVVSEKFTKYNHRIIKEIRYPDIKVKNPEVEGDTGYETLGEARKELEARAKREFTDNHIDEVKMSFEAKYIDITRAIEYKDAKQPDQIALGDTVTIIDESKELFLKARVVKYTYNVLEQQFDTLQISNFTADEMRRGWYEYEKLSKV